MRIDQRGMFRIAGWCGILCPIISFTCMLAAAAMSPWYSWTENYISDLGGHPGDTPTWAVHGAASILLNAGMIVSGSLGMLFVLVVRRTSVGAQQPGRSGASLAFIEMLALTCVGIFPESTGGPHGIAAVTFFLIAPFSLFLMGIGLIKTKEEKRFGLLVLLLGVVSFVALPLFALPRPVGGNAIIELMPAVCLAVFSATFGARLLRGELEYA